MLWRRWVKRLFIGSFVGIAAFDAANERVVTRSLRTVYCEVYLSLLYKLSDPQTSEELSALHLRAANIVLSCCMSNEGLYIKFGQGLSAFNHIMPPEYSTTLRVLLDQAPQVPIDAVRKIFQEETGKSFLEVFDSFEEAPVARCG